MCESEEAWAPLGEDSQIVASVRLDIAMMTEADLEPPPVLFKTFQLLETWRLQHGLIVKEIEGVKLSSAVRILGQYQARRLSSTFEYDQVWVRSTYSTYNQAMKVVALQGFDVDKAALAGTHADHVINRARLSSMPDSWVLLFPVSQHANSPFGAIESLLQPIDGGLDRINLPPLVALKLFCGRMPKNSSELDHAMRDIRGQFRQDIPEVASYCDEIANQARIYVGAR